MTRKKTSLIQLGVISCLMAADVWADEKDFGKAAPSESEIIQHFKAPTAAEQSAPESGSDDYQDVSADDLKNVRGLKKINSVEKTTGRKVQLPTTVAEQAISLQILFDYNSANLSDQAKAQLEPVGRALASGDLSGMKFRIEGHTDSVGGDGFNVDLSRRRAETVKAFLIEKYGISAAAIDIVGRGKSGLADPNNPESEVNRRVRIVSVSR